MWRLVRVLLAALLALVVTAPPATAEPRERRLSSLLGELWTTFIESAPGGDGCLALEEGRTVGPFTAPDTPITCTAEVGQDVFVVLWSSECSSAEVGTIWYAKNPGAARQCARATDAGITQRSITLDGVPIAYSEVESQVLRLQVPAVNVFDTPGSDVPAQDAVSVAHGWVTLLEDLAPGVHTLVISAKGMYPDLDGDGEPEDFAFTNTTKIIVR